GSNARGGIGLFDGSNNFVDNNSISSNRGEGLLLSGETGTSATGNTSSTNNNAGIVIFNPKEISVSNNTVNGNNLLSFNGDGSTNQWPAGIYADGASAATGAFTLHLDTNSLNGTGGGSGGNPDGAVGVYLGSSLRGDGTSVSSQTISVFTVGLRSSVSNISISSTKITSTSTGMLIDGGQNVAIDSVNFNGGGDSSSNQTDLKITATAGSISSLTGT